MDISVFCGYYPNFVDIIRIGHITRYLSYNVSHYLYSFVIVVDVIYIDPITNYLAHNVRPIFHIYSFSESDWFITYFPPRPVNIIRISWIYLYFVDIIRILWILSGLAT